MRRTLGWAEASFRLVAFRLACLEMPSHTGQSADSLPPPDIGKSHGQGAARLSSAALWAYTPMELQVVQGTRAKPATRVGRKKLRLEVQAKATSQDVSKGDHIHFPLKLKNYNDLRRDSLHPRILVVLLMPEHEADWLTQSTERLCLHHCAYWRSVYGDPATTNTTSVTVEVPKANIFGADQLTDIMQRVEQGGLP